MKHTPVVVVIHNLMLFDTVRPLIDKLGGNVCVVLPIFEEGSLQDMVNETYLELSRLGYKVEQSVLPAQLPCDIELSPYPYVDKRTPNIANARRRVRFLYGLAKESWNFSLDNNIYYDHVLTFGPYDTNVLSAYTSTYPVGNMKIHARVKQTTAGRVRVLYLPTYGEGSSIEQMIAPLRHLPNNFEIWVKLHHGTQFFEVERKQMLEEVADKLFDHHDNLADLLNNADVVISDCSGAIFDTIASETPLVVFPVLRGQGLGGLPSLEERVLMHESITNMENADDLEIKIHHAICTQRQKLVALRQEFFVSLGEDAVRRAHGFLEFLLDNSRLCHSTFEAARNNIRAAVIDVEENAIQVKQLRTELDETAKQLVSAKENINSLHVENLALRDAAVDRDQEILDIKSSLSWRLTRPLRFIKRFIASPRPASHELLKYFYWKLPSYLRLHFKGVRAWLLRWYSRQQMHLADKLDDGVLSFAEFKSNVLAERDNYRGVFIQEVAIDWHVALYQRPQHMAKAFSALGYLVIYRTASWGSDRVNGFKEVETNVWLSSSSEVDSIPNAIRSVYSTAFNCSPQQFKRAENCIILYEYIDHIDSDISGDDINVKKLFQLKEFAFRGGADFIVASAKKLEAEAKLSVDASKVLYVPNGVDTKHYRRFDHDRFSLPEHFKRFTERYDCIIGYFGAIAPWLWYDVIDGLTKKRPDCGFVFIGPDYYGGVTKLPKGENVLYLGVVEYKLLPAFAKRFDVCFIPFKPGEIAQTTSPLKLFEYFALEKPVVVTSDMKECLVYPEVFHADSVDGLSEAIDKAREAGKKQSYKQRLSTLADENTWIERAKCIDLIITGTGISRAN